MGHDVHFLSRLERVEGRALDLALGLYRDTPLLRWTLGRLLLPPDEDVIALPLSDAFEPAHALVSRTGKFITCLGPGMQVGHAARISWSALTAATAELKDWRGLEARSGRTARVLDRIMSAGPWLAREDFEDLLIISAVSPVHFAECVSDLSQSARRGHQGFSPRRFQTRLPQSREFLSLTWKFSWAAAHASLVTVEATRRLEEIRPGDLEPEGLASQAALPTYQAYDGMLTRSGWALGRLGPLVLDVMEAEVLKAAEAEEAGRDPTDFFFAMMGVHGLLATAVRSPDLHARVEDIFHRVVPADIRARTAHMSPDEAALGALRPDHSNRMVGLAATALAHLHEAEEGHPFSHQKLRDLAADFYTGRLADPGRLQRHTPPRQPTPAPLPASLTDLIRPPPASLHGSLYAEPMLIVERMHLIPALARQSAADHFFPSEALEALGRHFVLTPSLDTVLTHLGAEHRVAHATVQRSEPKAGRNDPCPCGSKQKYKRCCGK